MTIVPEKTSGKFTNINQLNGSIHRREKLVQHAKIMTNWIYKRAKPRNKRDVSQMTNTTRHVGIGTHREFRITKDSIEDFISDHSNESPKQSIGRDVGLLSGQTSRRREQTFTYLQETNQVSNLATSNPKNSQAISECGGSFRQMESKLTSERIEGPDIKKYSSQLEPDTPQSYNNLSNIEPSLHLEKVKEVKLDRGHVPEELQKQELNYLQQSEKPKMVKVLPGQSTQLHIKRASLARHSPDHDKAVTNESVRNALIKSKLMKAEEQLISSTTKSQKRPETNDATTKRRKSFFNPKLFNQNIQFNNQPQQSNNQFNIKGAFIDVKKNNRNSNPVSQDSTSITRITSTEKSQF